MHTNDNTGINIFYPHMCASAYVYVKACFYNYIWMSLFNSNYNCSDMMILVYMYNCIQSSLHTFYLKCFFSVWHFDRRQILWNEKSPEKITIMLHDDSSCISWIFDTISTSSMPSMHAHSFHPILSSHEMVFVCTYNDRCHITVSCE
jgi:hypothetical protein